MATERRKSNSPTTLKDMVIFFAIIVTSALCLSFIISVILYRFSVPEHPQKYLLTTCYVSLCVGLPIAVIASQNQFRLMVHRDPLETLSSIDTLSGLLTRRFFLQAATQHVQFIARTNQVSGLIVFDLDGFKAINDEFGNLKGDKVLMAVSKLARAELRSRQDLITRWWGDEFVIILHDADAEKTGLAAERLRKKIAETPIDLDDEQIHVTASFGYAPLTKYDSVESALSRADQAMKLAKHMGHNQVCSWSLVKLAA